MGAFGSRLPVPTGRLMIRPVRRGEAAKRLLSEAEFRALSRGRADAGLDSHTGTPAGSVNPAALAGDHSVSAEC